MKGVRQRLDFLTRGLTAGQRRVLGAVAIEGSLGLGTIQRVISSFAPSEGQERAPNPMDRSAPRALPTALPPWMAGWMDVGLLVRAPATKISSGPAAGNREGALSVHEEFEQLVLRQAAVAGELTEIVRVTRSLLGDRSRGPFALLLQTGQLVDFQRHGFAVPAPMSDPAAPSPADQMLRESICRPFEPDWFEGTWRQAAMPAANSILRESMAEPYECDSLFAWVVQKVEAETGALRSEEEGEIAVLAGCSLPVLHQVICEQALLRGRPDLIETILAMGAVPPVKKLAFEATACFLHGEASLAHDKLHALSLSDDGILGGGRRGTSKGAPDCGVALPLLVLLWLSKGEPSGTAEAKKLISSRSGDASPSGVLRALRTLVRNMAQPDADGTRLDVHQLTRGASAWEVLVLGLAVSVSNQLEVTRASWAKHLVAAGAVWMERGYRWIGRQSLFLARSLHQEYFEQEFATVKDRLFLDQLTAYPGELVLAEQITARPEWRRALDALAGIANEADDGGAGARRVIWYVDMVDGSIERPVLQELRNTGWTAGRRLSVARLREIASELPPEDNAVLARARALPGDRWEFAPEAMEALIGHPRVCNGVRDQKVEVIRGECQVRTEDDRGFLRICVEPAGATLGVNVVVENETRLVVMRVSPEMQRVIEALPHGMRVPQEHQREALAVLGKLSHGVEVHSPELGEEREVEADATPCFRISPVAGAWMVQAGVRPFGEEGRFFIAGTGRPTIASYVAGAKLRCTRDFKRERALVSLLIADCSSLLEQTLGDVEVRAAWEERQSWDFDEEGLLELMVELRDSSQPSALEWPEGNAWRLRGSVTSRSVKGTLRRKKGWYIASGTVSLDDESVLSLRDLISAPVIGKGRFVRLPSGDIVEVERRVRQVMDNLAAVIPNRGKGKELQIHAGALGVLKSLGEEGFTLDDESEGWLKRVEQVREKEIVVPSGLNAELREYQVAGYRWLSWLAELGLGTCLADDMGLGKTVQILAMLLSRQGKGPVLVVAPTSVCANWVSEVARFAPGLTVQEYMGSDRASRLKLFPRVLAEGEVAPEEALPIDPKAFNITVCSYGLLQQDGETLGGVAWDTVVLDEAQFIKNPDALRARAACGLSANCRIAATGTPVENHLGDLWSIFQFLNPGLLGTWRGFNQRFVKPVERDGNELARQTLKSLVLPFLLRRTKTEVLKDLPPLTTVRHEVRLSEAETLRYTLLRRDIHDKLHSAQGKRQNKLEILAEITRLRRFCCHPSLVFPDAGQDASKVQAFLTLVEELRENNHRSLVFSQFVDFLGLVRQQLDERGISYQYLDGSTSRAQRKARVDAFQGGEGTLFLISLKAGGFGLNLTAADYVIHLDPWWNPAVESQATDRAHRIGQDRPVTVYRLVTKDTIEESIVQLHEAKRALADSLLEEGGQAAKLDVTELLSLIEEVPNV